MKTLKRIVSIVIMTALFLGMLPAYTNAAEAETVVKSSGTCGENLTWKLDSVGTLTISGNGPMDDLYKPAPWYDQKAAIEKVVIEYGVTSIGDWAFEDCTRLVSITIPDSVASIGDGAFYYCTRLNSVTIPSGVVSIGREAFGICINLFNIIIPNSVTSIGEEAFIGCRSLPSVTIPNGVTRIENKTFSGCSSLMSVTIPDSVTSIGDESFRLCSNLTSLTIPYGVTSIGREAFNYCTKLTSISIPNSVTSIGRLAFHNCNRLASIAIPDSLTHIEDSLFSGCSGLTSITISNNMASIGYYAFDDCTNLQRVHYKGTLEQKASISINSYNAPLANATWHYECVNTVFGAEDCVYCATCDQYFLPDGSNPTAMVVFKNWDGTILSTAQYKYKEEINPPTVPIREHECPLEKHWSFIGWTTKITACAGNAEYTAVYSEEYINYTVTFVDEDSSELSKKTYHWGDKVIAPTAPTKDADNTYTYAFAGWDKEVVNCAGNTTYTATYTPNYIDYAVVFVDEDGTELSRKAYHWGDPVTAPADPIKVADNTYTYTFAGWDKDVVDCAGNATYTATYTPNYIDYTVTFKNWDGSVISTSTYHYGDVVTAPTAPTKPANSTYTYEFAGWDKSVVNCKGDAVYTATYTPNYIRYTVVFQNYDGTVLSKQFCHYGDAISIPGNPSRPSDKTYTYSFTGWDSEVTSCYGNKVYIATYNASYIDYIITFRNWDGSIISEQAYHYGDKVTEPANPSRAADTTYTYSFAGWDKEVVDCAGSTTYTATHTPIYIDYAVVFKNWDGTVLSESTYHYGDSVVTPVTPSRNADRVYTYEFAGWDKEVTSVSGDITYTATYTAHLRNHIVIVEIDGEQIGYPTLIDAVSDAPSGRALQLISDVEEDLVISKNLILDLNGFDITGNFTVTSGATLSVKDSQTDDYTIDDDFGYGKIVGTISGVEAEEGYLMITEADGVSFHRLNLNIATITFRPSVAGIYYQCHFGGDEVIKRNTTSYGIAMGANMMPGFAENTYTRFDTTSWNVGTDENGHANNLQNGSLLHGIMKTDNSNRTNASRAEMQIYGQAYIELSDGTRILGNPVNYSLKEIVEGTDSIDGVDSMWDVLTDVQKEEVLAFYNTFKPIVEHWIVPNIKSAAGK